MSFVVSSILVVLNKLFVVKRFSQSLHLSNFSVLMQRRNMVVQSASVGKSIVTNWANLLERVLL